MAHEVEHMAFRFRDGLPWHYADGVSTGIDGERVTAAEMERISQLNWTVEPWEVLARYPRQGDFPLFPDNIRAIAKSVNELADTVETTEDMIALDRSGLEDALAAAIDAQVVAMDSGHVLKDLDPVKRRWAYLYDHRAMIRTKDTVTEDGGTYKVVKGLGVVSPDYRPFQNRELFEFAEALIGEGKITFVTAGSLRGGKRVWVLAKYREDLPLPEVPEAHQFNRYLCLTNGHDGTAALRILMTTVNVVCQNTLNAALNTSGAQYVARHTAKLSKDRLIRDARRVIFSGAAAFASLGIELGALVQMKFSLERFEQLLEVLWPKNLIPEDGGPTTRGNKAQATVDALIEAYTDSPGNSDERVKDTGYAALQAFTYWGTHVYVPRARTARDPEDMTPSGRALSRREQIMESLWFENGYVTNTIAHAKSLLLKQAREEGLYTLDADEIERRAHTLVDRDFRAPEALVEVPGDAADDIQADDQIEIDFGATPTEVFLPDGLPDDNADDGVSFEDTGAPE